MHKKVLRVHKKRHRWWAKRVQRKERVWILDDKLNRNRKKETKEEVNKIRQ